MALRTRPPKTSCGVLVSDGPRVVVGQPARSTLWDIPKGVAERGESFDAAAVRELREETGLEAPRAALVPLGVHRYLPGKDLALFAWRPPAMPEAAGLRCTSYLVLPDGTRQPELVRFAIVTWDEALARVGKNMARVLSELSRGPSWPFDPRG
ncbi:MAG TPA: NUDIX hydrolase [Polyangiaceae bacterium]|nr:NUDIX hydrolase [Polyangiaceae bacterium]